jgi:hypothetical protein
MIANDPIPRNISVTLRFLRELSGHSLRRMAEALNKTPGHKVAGKSPKRPAKFDHDLIDAIENRQRLKIWQLSRYANWYGMPAGAILLFSQFASHLRDGSAEDVELTKTVAQAVKQICDYVIENADNLATATPGEGRDGKPRERRLEALVRACAHRDSSAAQKREDARQVMILYEIMNRYMVEAKKRYREHSEKKFSSEEEGVNTKAS